MEEVKPRVKSIREAGLLTHLLPAAVILWGFVAVYLLQLSIDRAGEGQLRERGIEELAYFPSGRFVREAAIEYQLIAADLIWLRAIQYYGYHLMTDQKYEWLGHVMGILTFLDPRFVGAYHFGAITLAWDANEPLEALALLLQGMKENPMSWRLPFDAGFIQYMKVKDYEMAGAFFDVTSRLPGAWPVVSRWAAFSLGRAGKFETAREMWLGIFQSTENRALRSLALRQLKLLKLEEALERLQNAVYQFQEDKGRLPGDLSELTSSGYIERIPEDPFGGRFRLEGDRVLSSGTPGREGLGE